MSSNYEFSVSSMDTVNNGRDAIDKGKKRKYALPVDPFHGKRVSTASLVHAG